jgi:hypothetical protein
MPAFNPLTPSSQTREAISSPAFEETILPTEEAIFRARRKRPEMIAGDDCTSDQTTEFDHVGALQPDLPGVLHRSPG